MAESSALLGIDVLSKLQTCELRPIYLKSLLHLVLLLLKPPKPWKVNKAVYVMINAVTSLNQQPEPGMWLFVKVPSQFHIEGVSQPNQVEIEARLNAFFDALDSKSRGHGSKT